MLFKSTKINVDDYIKLLLYVKEIILNKKSGHMNEKFDFPILLALINNVLSSVLM